MKHSLLIILSIFLAFPLSSCIKKKEVKPDEKDGTFVMIGKLDAWQSNNPPPFSFRIILGIQQWGSLYSRYTFTIGKGVTDSLGNFQIICDYYPKTTFYIHQYTLNPSVRDVSKKDITNLFTHPTKPNDTVYVDPVHLFK